MKIQYLAIVFLVIAIPLIVVLSYYMHLQEDTLRLQVEYDSKLAVATKEGIKAFESNTVEWPDYINKEKNVSERTAVTATVNTFLTSLANSLNVSRNSKRIHDELCTRDGNDNV